MVIWQHPIWPQTMCTRLLFREEARIIPPLPHLYRFCSLNPVERPPSTIPTDFGESSDEEDSQPQADTSARHDSYFSAAATAGPILPLQFWYVDNAGKPVLKKDEAAVTFNGGWVWLSCVCMKWVWFSRSGVCWLSGQVQVVRFEVFQSSLHT